VGVVGCGDGADGVGGGVAGVEVWGVALDCAVGSGGDGLAEAGGAVDAVAEGGGGGKIVIPESIASVQLWGVE